MKKGIPEETPAIIQKASEQETPLMKQYFAMKAKYPDAIMLFRVGDFYETFGEDAIKASKTLGITLTKRNNGGSNVELAGFPYHSLDQYMPKLIRAGYRVAVCDQLEKPSPQKKLVRRGVTEVVTPGVALTDNVLEQKRNNYLCALYLLAPQRIGIAFLDISTGEFLTAEGNEEYIEKLLHGYQPAEILYSKHQKNFFESFFTLQLTHFQLEEWVVQPEYADSKLQEHFQIQSFKGFGIDHMPAARVACGAILYYIASTENNKTSHINAIRRLDPGEHMWLDRFTIRNLELLHSQYQDGTALIDVLDQTNTPMGSRLLRNWLIFPLLDIKSIQNRLDCVERLYQDEELLNTLHSELHAIGDLERLISRLAVGKISPRELLHLGNCLSRVEEIKSLGSKENPHPLDQLIHGLPHCTEAKELIQSHIQQDAPVAIQKGGVICEGVHQQLDEYRYVLQHSRELLLSIQEKEISNTGISSLKIGFNNVFGYYLEVTNKYKEKVPSNWMRKQTLTGGERYITEELKDLEQKILYAEEKMNELEVEIYEKLIGNLIQFVPVFQNTARILSQCDCLAGFAELAKTSNYHKPHVDLSFEISITKGRHPVIEKHLPPGEKFVENDVSIGMDDCQIMMITGPNMSGKSAVLRQTALIVLMAQCGSFVPATSAKIGLVDKIFTRVGASDNITTGESTFMVEMTETASILNNISERSLLILDEIGRGTSTFDGISLAWAIVEYLQQHPQQPKTLFATHYHELNELADRFSGIYNYHISVKETGKKVLFLRKLLPGSSEHSFGIHVAQIAGIPVNVIHRAEEILHELESERSRVGGSDSTLKEKIKEISIPQQLHLFEATDPGLIALRNKIRNMEINGMTPIECMMALQELKKEAQ